MSILEKETQIMNVKQQKWIQEEAIYTPDQLNINGVEVMQDWEIPYMKKLASIATSNGGQVLELGFGLGLSAGFIQKSIEIQKHTIIEAHPKVIEFAYKKFPEALSTGRMEIVQGFWEDVSSRFDDESFDGILFDTVPLEPTDAGTFHQHQFFKEAGRLLKNSGTFTYFSRVATEIPEAHQKQLQEAGFSKIGFEVIEVSPPVPSQYWSYKTIVAPIIKK
jgi:guanidinoacetate N-methyltransferase